jgi:Family of unknown function (DUF5985)
MTEPVVNLFLCGMVTAGFLAGGLYFARFWVQSRDALFLAFAAAFWLLAANEAAVELLPEPVGGRSWYYLLRVAAFLLIAAAIVRKNISDAGED